MGGQTTKNTTVENRDPWGPSQPYLLTGLSEAQNIYNQQKANNTPGYTGDFVAQPTAAQSGAANNLLDFASGTGQSAVNSALGMGQTLTGLGAAGTGSAIGGLNAFAGRNATGSNVAAASQYANNPYMDSMVQAATRDATRNYAETTIPGINAGAAATGNLNSTRTGVAAGIAQRGLQDTIADTSAQLRGAAYQQGITSAQQDAAQQLQALQGAGQLSAGLGNLGVSQQATGADLYQKNTDALNIGNALVTANNQAPIDNALARLDYQNQQPWQNLNNAYAIFSNAGQQGGTTVSNSKQTTNPGAMGILGGTLGVLGSFMRCDATTKTIISKVGTLYNGATVYTFTYNDDPTGKIYIGPIAQEVEEIDPDAVVTFGGIKHVDALALGGCA